MQFIVNGMPQGKSRARTVRNKYTSKVHSFTPEKTQNYEDLIRWAYKEAGGKYFGEQPLRIDITAYFPIPQSFSKTKRKQALIGVLKPTKKPDCDNILKVVLDALNGVAYHDDKQVTGVSCNKLYSDTGSLTITLLEL